MIKITKWSPDTCGCVFNYTWDDTTSEDTRIHTFSTSDKLCSYHSNLSESNAYTTVQTENNNKNKAYGVFQLQGVLAKDFTWYFDANRKLFVSAPSINKVTLQTLLDSQLGSGVATVY